MKKTLLITFLAFFASTTALFADPWDCMTEDQAKELIKYLKKNPFVLDYCDCCDAGSREQDNTKLMGHLVKIESMEIVPCSWDETQFSVNVNSTTVLASGYIEKGNFIPEKAAADDVRFYSDSWAIAINYAWNYNGGSPVRLYKKISYTADDFDCGKPKKFPDPKRIPSSKAQKAYLKYYNKK